MLRRKFGKKREEIKRGQKIRRIKSFFIAYVILRILFTTSNQG
jgi:hypothetical protein